MNSLNENALAAVTARYRHRADAFEQILADVDPERWTDPSPCEDWDARGVVSHVLEMHAVMLAPLDRSLSTAPSIKDDALAAFRSARADIEAVLTDPDLATTHCETPAGSTSAAETIDNVASEDLIIHGWDLARATGQDHTMDPGEVESLWRKFQALPAEVLERYQTPGAFGPNIVVFGPEIPVPADAPLEDRLLGLCGRDPHWVRPGI